MAQLAVPGQLELQGLGAARIEPSEDPVPAAESLLDLLHDVQSPFVSGAEQMAIGRLFEYIVLGYRDDGNQTVLRGSCDRHVGMLPSDADTPLPPAPKR